MSDIGIGVFLLLVGVVSLVVVGFSAGYWFRSLMFTNNHSKKVDAKKDLVVWNGTKIRTQFSKEMWSLLDSTPLFPVNRYVIDLESEQQRNLDKPSSNLYFIRDVVDVDDLKDRRLSVVAGFRIPFSHVKNLRDMLDHHLESNRILNGLGDKRDSDKNEEVEG